jgi:glycosyltransferase involved in cell wall biosynthesis
MVLYTGRIIPVKGVAELVQALPSGVPLTIAGPTYDVAYYQRLQRLAQGKDVTFTNRISDSDLVAHYQRATVAVAPSLHSELLGLVVLEAMACGTPVICTNVGGMPELVEDGVTGFVVEPGDERALRERIELMMGDTRQARRMGEAARARVSERFTWDLVAERCLEAYTTIASDRSA